MKILNLYFKNINSLEGESRIHFDQAPIADGGVFAITGPNGSGKSSILDVITLGLYGETYRFDRPADYVMTKSTAESFAHVEFALGDENFRSSWQVKRKDGDATGELLSPEMKLVQLNGSEQVLEQSTQKVRDKIAELTGMDFHKFSKSMVLAQGDFASFLNALDSERMDILEKISGTDVYVEYKKQVEEKHTQAQDQLQLLEQDLSAIPVMDELTMEAREHDLVDFKEQQTELETEQTEVQQQLSSASNITTLQAQIETLLNKQQNIESLLQENQTIIDKVEATPDVTGLQDEIVEFENKAEEAQQSKKTLDSYRSELKMLQKQLKSDDLDESTPTPEITPEQQKINIDDIKQQFNELKLDLPQETSLLQSLNLQIDDKKSILSTTEDWLQEHDADKTLLESFPEIEKLKHTRVELAILAEKLQTQTKWSNNTNDALAIKKSSINTLKQKNSELLAQIKQDEDSLKSLADGHSLYELQEMEMEQQERVENFTELYNLAAVNSKLGNKGLFSHFFSSKDEHSEEQHLRENADQLQIEIGLEENIVQTIELAIKNELLLQKMQPDREHLIDGKPCPLCGAIDHPYATEAPASSILAARQALVDQNKKVKALNAEAKDIEKQIDSLQKQNTLDDQKEGKLQVVNSQWNRLANKLNAASLDLDIDNLSLMKKLRSNEKKELVSLSKLVKKYTKQQSLITKALSIIESNKVTMDRLSAEFESLEIEKNSRQDVSEVAEQEQSYNQHQKQEQVLAEKVLEQLNLLGEIMPEPGEEDDLNDQLNIRKQNYHSRTMQQEALSKEIPALEAKIKSSINKVDEITQQIELFSGQVQQEEVAGLHLSLIEKQKLIAEKEKEYSQQQTDLSSLKQNLSANTAESGQADLNELKDTIALVQRKPELQQKHQELELNINKITSDLDKLNLQLEQEQTQQVTNKTTEELQQQQKLTKEKLEIVKQEVDSLQNKLSKQDDLKAKHEELAAKVESQKAELEIYKKDIQLVADENNLDFRHKVQQVLTDKLLSQANQVLEKISGRYYVRKVESEHGLALEIEDTKQHNVRRLPKTLSGGESFIVSLSLALGLSEMANDSHAINSLFLDEGFGNLDADSLYMAMTTLESLKTHGKTVGVISHVDGVRKRIKTQIEMIKKPNGLSAIKMVS